jgi:hypothetical protein
MSSRISFTGKYTGSSAQWRVSQASIGTIPWFMLMFKYIMETASAVKITVFGGKGGSM